MEEIKWVHNPAFDNIVVQEEPGKKLMSGILLFLIKTNHYRKKKKYGYKEANRVTKKQRMIYCYNAMK